MRAEAGGQVTAGDVDEQLDVRRVAQRLQQRREVTVVRARDGDDADGAAHAGNLSTLVTRAPVRIPGFLDSRRARRYARPMLRRVRTWTRGLLGVRRDPTYYLPWLTRPGLDCVVLLNNIESRFTSGREGRDLDATVTQFDSEGRGGQPATRHADRQHRRARGAADPGRRRLRLRDGGRARIKSDLYVALVDGESVHARRTAGRSSSSTTRPGRARCSRWPARSWRRWGTRAGLRARSVRLSRRGQPLAPAGPESVERRQPRSRRRRARRRAGRRPAGLHPAAEARGSLDVDSLAPAAERLIVEQLRLTGNAWFNLYLVGAGTRDLEGALSLMHVK